MTIDHRVDVDYDPQSSQLPPSEWDPPPSSARVRWSHSNPETLLLKQQLKDCPVQPQLGLFDHTSLRHPSPPRHSNPLPSDHPAKAKKFDLRQQDSPSMPHHVDDLHSAIGKMNGKLEQNAKQKADRDRRHPIRLNHKSLLPSTDESSNQLIVNPSRLDPTFQDPILFPPPSHHTAPRFQLPASDPDINPVSAGQESNSSTPFPVSSKSGAHSFFDTFSKPMDIDWDDFPSSTPTPLGRPRPKPSTLVSCSSSMSKSDSSASSSSSSAVSPLSINHAIHSRSHSRESHMSTDRASTVTSPVDRTQSHLLVTPYKPSASQGPLSPDPPIVTSTAIGPPQQVSTKPSALPASPPRLTPPPSSNPVPPPLSRPFAPPSQIRPGNSQVTRPRPSQRPPPLGMCRVLGQTSGGVNKPFKLTVAGKAKKPSPAPNALSSERDPGLAGGSMTILTAGNSDIRRSMSPVIPDPPHIVARAGMQGSQPPVLEMSARRPEPRHHETKDADSSADMWACFHD